MATFMAPPPAATFLAFYQQRGFIFIFIGTEDSSIKLYNVHNRELGDDKVSIKRESVIPNFCES
jgi:hypothetical protein